MTYKDPLVELGASFVNDLELFRGEGRDVDCIKVLLEPLFLRRSSIGTELRWFAIAGI